jgi:hypothetical protein
VTVGARGAVAEPLEGLVHKGTASRGITGPLFTTRTVGTPPLRPVVTRIQPSGGV